MFYGYPDVPKATPFDLWPFDLVKSNNPVLHSLQTKGCQKSRKYRVFDDPTHIIWAESVVLVPGLMEKSSSVFFFFDEMRLKRSLRSLRLLRLLRSLRPLRFLMPGNHSVCQVHAVFFNFLRPKRLLRSLSPLRLSWLLRSFRPLSFSELTRALKSIR